MLTLSRIMVSPVQEEVMEDVCCPANSVAISIPVISSSFRYLPPYTCTRKLPFMWTSDKNQDQHTPTMPKRRLFLLERSSKDAAH